MSNQADALASWQLHPLEETGSYCFSFIVNCREAFSGFDAEVVAKFNEKKIASISAEYGIVISQVRGVIDNSIRILEAMKYP